MSETPHSQAAFDLDRIVRETFATDVVFHEEIESTNTAALELCQADRAPNSLLVLTAQQTAGRGRGANVWWAGEGSLAFSLVLNALEFGLPQASWPQASLITGLSVCVAVESLVDQEAVALKWPNDVHLQGRKIGGVLIEVGPRSSGRLVIGIGVNVNNSLTEAPMELRERATSLIDVTGQMSDRTDVLVTILQQLEHQLSRLAHGDPALPSDWQKRCALHGRVVEVTSGIERKHGLCQGIDEEGALVLSTAEGPVRFFGGSVTRIE